MNEQFNEIQDHLDQNDQRVANLQQDVVPRGTRPNWRPPICPLDAYEGELDDFDDEVSNVTLKRERSYTS